uniref:Cytochrome c oxidase assembly factor 6 n=1 Tax=Globodera pallida TaxID=36090 RepID=A0A183CLS5_GLOPA
MDKARGQIEAATELMRRKTQKTRRRRTPSSAPGHRRHTGRLDQRNATEQKARQQKHHQEQGDRYCSSTLTLRFPTDAFFCMPNKEPGLRENRTICYRARDLFFDCLASNDQDELKCQREYAVFGRACPATWVEHFVRKHKLEKYKQVIAVQDGKYIVADKTGPSK